VTMLVSMSYEVSVREVILLFVIGIVADLFLVVGIRFLAA